MVARLFVGDTGALLNEIVQAARRKELTSMMAGLHCGSIRLFIANHVFLEIEHDLPLYAQGLRHPVDPLVAVNLWRSFYLPHIRVVEVSDKWGADDPRIDSVANRHHSQASAEKYPDTDTARLAFALSECFVLSRDKDLIDNEFGQLETLPLLLAAANEGEIRLIDGALAVPVALGEVTISGGIDLLRKLPVVAQLGVVAAGGFLIYRWQHDPDHPGRLRQVLDVATDLATAVAPPLRQTFDRSAASRPIWELHGIQPVEPRTLSERVARVLALGPTTGLLAGDVAREVAAAGSVTKTTRQIRELLRGCSAFIEIRRGRWVLGSVNVEYPPVVSPVLVADWLRRAHAGPPKREMPTTPQLGPGSAQL